VASNPSGENIIIFAIATVALEIKSGPSCNCGWNRKSRTHEGKTTCTWCDPQRMYATKRRKNRK
jgi:hypothetical protein